jgi:hypothetical protein
MGGARRRPQSSERTPPAPPTYFGALGSLAVNAHPSVGEITHLTAQMHSRRSREGGARCLQLFQ